MRGQWRAQRRTAVPLAVLKTLRQSTVPHEIFDQILTVLVPDGHHARILQILENRVTIRAVKHWRKGRRRIPQWALDRVFSTFEPIQQAKEKAGL